MQVDFAEVNRAALAQAPMLLREWLPGGRVAGSEYEAPNPTRTDHKPGSFKVNLQTGVWGDFATDAKGGDLVSLHAYLNGQRQAEAARHLAERLNLEPGGMGGGNGHKVQAPPAWKPIVPVPADAGKSVPHHPRLGKPGQVWTYRDGQGSTLYRVCRFDTPEGKEVLPLTFCRALDGKRAWRWQGFPEPRALYGLERLAAPPDRAVLVVEGEKTANAAQALFPGMVATTSPGGSKASHKADWSPLHGRQVVIWPDADPPGVAYAQDVARLALAAEASSVRVVNLPVRLPQGWDLADPLPEGWTHERLQELLDQARPWQPPAEPPQDKTPARLAAVTLEDFLARKLPPRGHLLEPVIPEQGLVMLYAARGMGKTYAGLSIAHAVAGGGCAFRWRAPRPRPVLYLDGEMPATVMQERLARIVDGADSNAPVGYFKIITPDLVPDGIMPNLATPEGQTMLEPLLEGVALLVVDNVATLARAGRENEVESWLPVQGWLLAQRRAGRSVLLVHHAGKGGDQRGTSAREDVLDVVIRLSRPQDYQANEGARFIVDLTKARGLVGQNADPFEASLTEQPNGALIWAVKDAADVRLEQVRELKGLGLSIREIAEETGIPKSTVARLAKKL